MAETISSTLRSLQAGLVAVAGQTSLFEAETILQHVLHCTRSELYLNSGTILSPEQSAKANEIIKRRLSHEPLAYIHESIHFYDSDIIVTPAVLIPRSETEILVEIVLKNEKALQCAFIDVGTGSGAIAMSLQKERPLWNGIAEDISINALKVAKRNCPSQIKIVCCDCLSAIKADKTDFIVSNPPYVSKKEMLKLDPGVKMFEPAQALYGGEDGLDFYRILSHQPKKILKSNGRIYLEINSLQADSVAEIFISEHWNDIKIFPDLSKRPRVMKAIFTA